MKNFVRLVKSAWPYRYRFGVSVACALMVALLSVMELGAVLPVLKILINNDNPQRWISTKIDSIDEAIEHLDARREELGRVERAFAAGEGVANPFNDRFTELETLKAQLRDDLEAHRRRVDLPDQHGGSQQSLAAGDCSQNASAMPSPKAKSAAPSLTASAAAIGLVVAWRRTPGKKLAR